MTQIQQKRVSQARKRPGKASFQLIAAILMILMGVIFVVVAALDPNRGVYRMLGSLFPPKIEEDAKEPGGNAQSSEAAKPKRVLTPEQKEDREQATSALMKLERLEAKAAQGHTSVDGIRKALDSQEVREAKRDYENKLAKLHPDDVKTLRQRYDTHFEYVQFQIERAGQRDEIRESLDKIARDRGLEDVSFHPPPGGGLREEYERRRRKVEAAKESVREATRIPAPTYERPAPPPLETSRTDSSRSPRHNNVTGPARFTAMPDPKPRFSAAPDDELLPIVQPDISVAVQTTEDLSDPRIAARADFLRRDIPVPGGGVAAMYEVRWSLENGGGSGKFMLGIYDVPDDRNFRGRIFLAGNPQRYSRDFFGKMTYKPDVEYPISIDLDPDTGVAAADCRSAMLQRFFQVGATINGEKSTNLRLKIDDAGITGVSKAKTVSFTFARLTLEEVQEIRERNAK